MACSDHLTPALRYRLAKLLAMMGSPVESESVAALRALGRVLAANSLDFNDLAESLSSGAVTTGSTVEEPEPTDRWDPPAAWWGRIVDDLIHRQAWRTDWEENFLYGVADWVARGRAPSFRQREVIEGIAERARGP